MSCLRTRGARIKVEMRRKRVRSKQIPKVEKALRKVVFDYLNVEYAYNAMDAFANHEVSSRY